MHTLQSIVLYICSNSMQFWQCSILLQFLQIINAKDFAFRSLQNLQSSTSADCTVSLHAMVHCNPKCIAVIPLQFHCDYLQCSILIDKCFSEVYLTNFCLYRDSSLFADVQGNEISVRTEICKN